MAKKGGKNQQADDDGSPRGSRELVPVNQTRKEEAKLVLDRVVRELPVDLTSEEMAHRGRVCGEKMAARNVLEGKFEAIRKRHKADVDELDVEIADIGRILELGSETRSVQCDVLLNWEDGRVETVRNDTGEIIASRSMTPEERTRDMFRGKRPRGDGNGDEASPS